MKRENKRALALAAALLFSLALLLGLAFLAGEAGHVCTGEHCPVCATLAGLYAVWHAAFLSAAALAKKAGEQFSAGLFPLPPLLGGGPCSLVSQKVRLDE